MEFKILKKDTHAYVYTEPGNGKESHKLDSAFRVSMKTRLQSLERSDFLRGDSKGDSNRS